jgi:hypothetical protein
VPPRNPVHLTNQYLPVLTGIQEEMQSSSSVGLKGT